MLLPVVLLFTLFITLPALVGLFYSFTNYEGYGDWKFVGLTNYIALFTDPRILQAYGFTLGFSIVTVIVVNAIAMALAIGLNAKIKLKTSLRGVFFIPMVISGIVIAYVFNFLFSTSIPAIATSLGIGPLENSILANPSFAWLAIVIVTAWQAVPGAIIIYLAGTARHLPRGLRGCLHRRRRGVATVPQHHLPAHLRVRGHQHDPRTEGLPQRLRHHRGPHQRGPGTSTFSVAMTIFTGFTSGDYAYQMANAVIFFLVTVIISLLQLQLIRRRGVSL